MADPLTGIGATTLIMVHDDSQTNYITLYDQKRSMKTPTDIDFECVARSLGSGTHLLVNRYSGLKKLVILNNDKIKILNTLDEVDDYDGDGMERHHSEDEEWDGDGMQGGNTADVIVSEYKGEAILKADMCYLKAPKFDQQDAE